MRKVILMLLVAVLMFSCTTVTANGHIPVLLYHDIQTEFEPDREVITVTP